MDAMKIAWQFIAVQKKYKIKMNTIGVTQLKFIFYFTAKIAKVSAKLRKDIC